MGRIIIGVELSFGSDNNYNVPINGQPPEDIRVDGMPSALVPNSTELDVSGKKGAGTDGEGMDIDRLLTDEGMSENACSSNRS